MEGIAYRIGEMVLLSNGVSWGGRRQAIHPLPHIPHLPHTSPLCPRPPQHVVVWRPTHCINGRRLRVVLISLRLAIKVLVALWWMVDDGDVSLSNNDWCQCHNLDCMVKYCVCFNYWMGWHMGCKVIFSHNIGTNFAVHRKHSYHGEIVRTEITHWINFTAIMKIMMNLCICYKLPF